MIVPGLTLWNHPRFFAYFANTGSEPGILAELLTAALNVNAMAWLTSPAATELEQLTLDWLAQLLGLPAGLHGHIEDTASTSTLAALAAARTLRPGGVVYASEQAHFSVEKAARILGLELPDGPGRRRVPDAARLPARRRHRRRRHRRQHLDDLGRPACRSSAARCRGGRCLAPRRRGLRRLGRGLPGVSLVSRRASSSPTRSSSTRTSGSSRRWTARRSGRGARRRSSAAFAAHGDYLRLDATARSTCASTGPRSAAASAR